MSVHHCVTCSLLTFSRWDQGAGGARPRHHQSSSARASGWHTPDSRNYCWNSSPPLVISLLTVGWRIFLLETCFKTKRERSDCCSRICFHSWRWRSWSLQVSRHAIVLLCTSPLNVDLGSFIKLNTTKIVCLWLNVITLLMQWIAEFLQSIAFISKHHRRVSRNREGIEEMIFF